MQFTAAGCGAPDWGKIGAVTVQEMGAAETLSGQTVDHAQSKGFKQLVCHRNRTREGEIELCRSLDKRRRCQRIGNFGGGTGNRFRTD